MHSPRTVGQPLGQILGEGWVAVVMLHGLPWLCCMGCRGYVAWVAVVMLRYHVKVKSNPRFSLGGEFDKNSSEADLWLESAFFERV